LCAIASLRLPLWPLHFVILGGVVLVTRAAYFSGDPDGFYALFYIWIGLFGVFFFSRTVAIGYLVAIGVSYAWLLAELDTASAV
ncbi:hypothetical protein, partial [Salmonella enterica]|uniref:hypothetical protein n=1 Tax=Salmonella enterica TaxID=28901 RepID=UPI0032985770